MQYSLKKITTAAACDALLTIAQKKKQNLERQRRRLGESIDTFCTRIDLINKESAETQIIIDAFTTAYHALPEGKHKAGMLIKIKRREVRRVRLQLKAFTYNAGALLVRQLKYNRLDNQVSAMTQHIAALKYLRMTISKAALRISRKSPAPAAPAPFWKQRNSIWKHLPVAGNRSLWGKLSKRTDHEDYFHYRRVYRFRQGYRQIISIQRLAGNRHHAQS